MFLDDTIEALCKPIGLEKFERLDRSLFETVGLEKFERLDRSLFETVGTPKLSAIKTTSLMGPTALYFVPGLFNVDTSEVGSMQITQGGTLQGISSESTLARPRLDVTVGSAEPKPEAKPFVGSPAIELHPNSDLRCTFCRQSLVRDWVAWEQDGMPLLDGSGHCANPDCETRTGLQTPPTDEEGPNEDGVLGVLVDGEDPPESGVYLRKRKP
jgi:hypothetical protein